MANVIQKLTALIEQEAPAFGLFLVAQTTGPAKLFQFYVDSEEPLSMKTLSDFTFEISSPGAERPLTNRKQYTKHVGRSFEFQLTDKLLSGKLLEIKEGDVFVITEIVKEKGKKAIEVTHEVPFSLIQSATIIISFK